MYPFSLRERGGDVACARRWRACRRLRARRALLSGSALVGAGLCLSLAFVPTPVLAVDISTQAQLDAAIAAGQTSINIVSGNLALSNAQTFAAGTDLTVAAGASLSMASNQAVGSLSGAGTLILGTNGLAVGSNNTNTAFSGTINLTNQGYNPTYGTFAKTGTGTLTINNATITQGESYITQGAMAQTGGNTTFTYLAVGTGTTGGNPNVGALNVSGGTISFGTGLQVGDFGGQGTLNQTGGTVSVNPTCGDPAHCAALHIGNQGGTGTYNISGGELDLVGSNNELGRSTGTKPPSAGTLNISGTGVVDLSANGSLIIGYGNENTSANTSQGVINQTGGTLRVHNGSTLYLTGANSSSSVYNLNGGTLEIGGNSLKAGYGGTANPYQFNLGGGTIKVIESALVTSVNATLASGVSTIDTNGLGATWSGVLSGTGSLAKAGAGTLTLSGANTYSGGTALNAGTLAVGSNTALGTGTLTFANGTTLRAAANGLTLANTVTLNGTDTIDTQANAMTLSGSIGGTGGLAKVGTGKLTISGANSYSGATNVTAGTLQAGAANTFSAASAFTVGAGAFLDLNRFNQTIGSLAGAGTVINNGAGAATLTAGGDNTSTTFSGTLQNGTSALGLTKSGTGTLTLSGANTYSGATNIAAGTLQAGATNTFSAASAFTVGTGATLDLNGFNQTIGSLAGAGTVNVGTNNLTVGGDNTSTAFSGTMNMTNQGYNPTYGTFTKTGSGTLTIDNATITQGESYITQGAMAQTSGNTTVTYLAVGTGTTAGNPNVGALNVSGGTISFGTGLQVSDFGAQGTLNQTGGTVRVEATCGDFTHCAALHIGNQGGTGTYNISGGELDLVGGLNELGRSTGTHPASAGTLTLSGANTYSGGTALNAGTLAVGSSTALGTGALTFASGTTLQSAANGLSLANAMRLNGTDTVDTQANVLTLSGIIAGTGALTKIGTGTLTLAGTSTYSGGTALNAGTLAVGNSAALGNGALTFATGTTLQAAADGLTLANAMTLNGTDTVDTRANALTLAGAISGTGALIKIGVGSLTLTGTNSYTGGTTISSGFLLLGDDATTGKIVGAVTNNAFFEIVNADTSAITTITNNGSTVFDAGTSASSAAITNGAGSLLSFTGNSTAANATITTNAVAKTQFLDTSTGGNAQFITNAGGVVDFSGTSGPAGNNRITAGSIAGAGSYYLGANQLTTGGNNLPSAVTGVISDCGPSGTECTASGVTGGSLVKVGNATLTLTGTNTYSGGTTINSGILAVSSDANLGAASGGLSFGGGTLQYLAGFTSARTIVLNTGGGTFDTNGFTATLAGPIGGTGGLTKVGAGELDLLGVSSYAGATNVNAGTLMAGATNSFSAASAFTVGAGAFLDIGGFDQTIGSLAGAGTVQNGGLAAATLTTGGDNRSTTFSGVIQDCCSPLALTKVGTGTLTISGANNTYTGATTVNGGTLAVTGDIRTSSGVTVNGGAILSGTGTVSNININAGGTLAAGLPSAPGTLTATGSLVLQAAATYLVQVSPATASRTAVTGTSPGSTGTATLNGATLAINAAGGGYAFGTKYTVLSATGGVNGAFANTTATSGPVTATVSYDANDVFITLSQAFITMPISASGNAKGLAHALNAYIADPPLPPAFQNLFNLSPAQLAEALAQLSGENNAGGGQQASFQMMNEFLLLMLNPFDADRGGGFSGAGFGAGNAVSRFAPDQERALPPEIARAYAAVTPPSERSIPFSARWNVWASAFGGTNNTNGDPNGTGSHNFNARTGGVAAGVDYKLTPDTLIGFALAGGGTSWGLSQSLGSGSTDAFQAGLYGSQRFGAWYVSGAVAFANYWASTTRTVTLPAVDTLNAGFNAQSWGGRAEAGYRIAWAPVNLAPYVAVQAQSFSTPNYTETATSGSNAFALSYASHTASVVRSELGSWLSKSYLLADNVLVTAFVRAAWAHDWEDTPQATATFVGLAPIATFIVNGAKPADNLAVMTAGAEIRMASGWALMGKFDGEFGEGTQTYVGTARARYAW